ncbi:glycosyltransferase family 2 protein [Terriglobus sp.]|uniref:glycosyltransferase family 2 protein n=1 Tax=Terriglobus sp. TaxID=1889013 RepID=UPI003B003899
MTEPQTAVVLLNWNGCRDTVACVASLHQSESQDFIIVICDNASEDDSWEKIQSWCEANASGTFAIWEPGSRWDGTKKVALIQTGSNLGFAGGCNVGIRFVLQQTSCDYLWLLNNDTVVYPDALTNQVQMMQTDRGLGPLGSTLVYFDQPDTVQCFGGYGFNFWTARVRPFPFVPDPKQPPSVAEVESRMRYVSGASTFVSRRFVESVGLLNEQYFLYFEEIDWAVRGKGFRISYCPDSIVLHKEGRSIGSASAATRRSRQSELWLTRNRILFTRTYFPLRLPVALVWVLLVALIRLCTGKREMAATLLQGVWKGLRAPIRPLPKFSEWPPETLQAAARHQGRGTGDSAPGRFE